MAEAVGHLLKETSVWPVLETAFNQAGREVVESCYLDDLVKMVYRPQTPSQADEYKVKFPHIHF